MVKSICHSPPSLTLPAEGREQEENSRSCFEPLALQNLVHAKHQVGGQHGMNRFAR